MLVSIRMGTNMVAGNQQKQLSLSFATKSVNLSLEELKNIKRIVFLIQEPEISRNKSRNKSLFNQLGRHVNAASRKNSEIQA